MNFEEGLEVADEAIFVQAGRRLNEVEIAILQGAWQGKTYEEIANETRYSVSYLKRGVGPKLWNLLTKALGEAVSKTNFRSALERKWRTTGLSQGQRIEAPALSEILRDRTFQIIAQQSPRIIPAAACRSDWGEAVDVSLFCGRTSELSTLTHWIANDSCRLITLLGMGGIGKTALSVKLAELVQGEFEYLIWRSLRDAPPIEELLTTVIQFLSNQQETTLPDSIGSKISRIMELFQQTRCLLILDNFDAVFDRGKRAGTYRSGYKDYGELLRRVGEVAHQSCLVLTSREKPQEVGVLEGERHPTRTLQLSGIEIAAGQDILQAKGLTGPPGAAEGLIEHYRGNPLALKIAATSIQDLFEGDIVRFLAQGSGSFTGIGELIEQQFSRLFPLEKQLMYWLAINREPVSLSELQADIIPELPIPRLIEALESLRWRSLIESSPTGFTQQPIVMECITERLIEQISHEIIEESPRLLISHALMKAQAKDYIRESQSRILLKPTIAELMTELGSPKQLEYKLGSLLNKLREERSGFSGYGGGNLLNLFRQLETDLTGYDFSQLQIRQAYLQDMNLHHVNFAQAEFEGCTFATTFGGIVCVTFSSDGQRLATSDSNGKVQIWSVKNGKQLADCRGHEGPVWSIVFSPDNQILASCGRDHTIRLWDVSTGRGLQIFQGHTSVIMDLAFSPDGQTLVSGGEDQSIKVWNLGTGQCRMTLHGHTNCIWSVTFSPDGQLLASSAEDHTIKIWDLSGNCLKTLQGHQSWVTSIAFHPDGQTLASGSRDSTVKFWNIKTGDCFKTLQGHHGPVRSIAFSPNGQLLASGSDDQTVRLWDVCTGECLKTLQKHTNRVWSVAFHIGGELLASGGDDHSTRLWTVETGQCVKALLGHDNPAYAIALTGDHRLLVSGHEDQTIKLWNLDTEFFRTRFALSTSEGHHQATSIETQRKRSLKSNDRLSNRFVDANSQPLKTLRGHRDRVLSVACSPQEPLLASAGSDRTIRLWSVHTGQCLKILQGHTSWVAMIAFSPNGQLLASGSYDHTVKLWEVETGRCIHTLEGHPSWIVSVCFSSTGHLLVSGGQGQTIKLWEIETGQCLQTIQGHVNGVWAVTFSPQDQLLASCGADHLVKLWDVKTGECLETLQGHTNQVLSAVFSSDGSKLISGSADKTIKIWNVKTGECIKTLEGHQNWVWSLVLDRDDQTLFSGSQDETIQCWDIHTGECLQRLRAPRPYEQMNITGTIGLTEPQKATLVALGAVDLT